MKRIICMILLTIVCFLLQTTVFQKIALADTVPNLILILIVAIGYMRGPVEGMLFGLFCGIIIDCQYSQVIGIYGFLYMLVGYLSGVCNKIYYRDEYTIPLILVAVCDIIFNFSYYIIGFLLRNRLNLFYYVRRIMLPELVYTVLVSILLYKLIHIIIAQLEGPSGEEV